MVSIRAFRPHAKTALAAALLASVSLTAACSQAPSADTVTDLQTRLAAAEARATAAEKRAKSAEDAAGVHYQETVNPNQGAAPDAGQPDPQFGQPMNDTAPIDTAPPPAPAPMAPGALSN